jgi:DNA-binding CsgD family transcriptional regulator
MLPINHPVSKVSIDKWNRISLFSGGKITLIILEDDTPTYIDSSSFIPLRNSLFNAFENILFLSENKAIIGTIDGFLYYDRDLQFFQNFELKLNLRSIYSFQEKSGSLQREDLDIDSRKLRIPHSQNNIFIEVAAPAYQNRDYLEIQYTINTQEVKLTSRENTIMIQDLKGFNNKINIIGIDRARDIASSPIELEISILPPWYNRWYAYIGYTIILILLVLIIIINARKYINKIRIAEQANQAEKMEVQKKALLEQAEEAEKQVILLKNEKLALENRIKAEEIANSTMELVHKNKMLLDVKETLKVVQKEKNIDSRNHTIKSIVKRIDRDLDNEEKWIVFEKNFDEVHENFLNRLKESHTALTAKDLRLCAYLRMNLSSKEIAPLLRISIRSVEISRYRLRKKLELPREQNLTDYILLF